MARFSHIIPYITIVARITGASADPARNFKSTTFPAIKRFYCRICYTFFLSSDEFGTVFAYSKA